MCVCVCVCEHIRLCINVRICFEAGVVRVRWTGG